MRHRDVCVIRSSVSNEEYRVRREGAFEKNLLKTNGVGDVRGLAAGVDLHFIC